MHTLADVDITAELADRPSRPADHAAENRVLGELLATLAESGDALQAIVDAAMRLCDAASGGLGLLEGAGPEAVVRWQAVAGCWAGMTGRVLPCAESPAAAVVERDAVVLLANPERCCALPRGTAPAVEMLLAPVRHAGRPVGTLWVVSDQPSRRFDAEDARLLARLAAAASVATVLAADLTARQQASAEARFHATMLDAVGQAVVATDPSGRVVYWNRVAEQLYGWTAAEAIGRNIADLTVTPDALAAAGDVMQRVAAGETWSGEFRVRNRAGREFPAFVTDAPILDAAGGLTAVVGISTDISAQKRAESALRESEEAYRTLVGQVKDYAIFRTDCDGRALTWNEGVERVLGFRESEFVGQDVTDRIFVPEDVRADVPRLELEHAVRAGSASDDRWMQRKNGERFFALGMTTAIAGEDGELVGFTKVMRDHTSLKRAEDALRDADRRKDEFLALLAHELRNPLAPIRNAVELLKADQLTSTHVAWGRDVIDRQVGHMGRLLDDLLDVSRITRDRLELRKQEVELNGLVRAAVEAARPLCDDSGQDMRVELSGEPILVDADATRLEQVFVNLIGNACKYTERGGHVFLRVERQGGEAVVSTRDSGIGLEPEQIARIFDLFAQVDSSQRRARGGLGIGLTLVKRLVELHGGSVSVASAGLGEGSEFVVRLPLGGASAVEPPASRAEAARQQAGLRILVVDDNVDAADTLTMLLALRGHQVETAYEGEAALGAAEQFEPDVVLLDIGLPTIDGFEVCRRLRATPAGAALTIVAMTGWGQPEDKQRALQAGFDAHLTKPADHALLAQVLAGVRRRRAAGS